MIYGQDCKTEKPEMKWDCIEKRTILKSVESFFFLWKEKRDTDSDLLRKCRKITKNCLPKPEEILKK